MILSIQSFKRGMPLLPAVAGEVPVTAIDAGEAFGFAQWVRFDPAARAPGGRGAGGVLRPTGVSSCCFVCLFVFWGPMGPQATSKHLGAFGSQAFVAIFQLWHCFPPS